MKNKIFHHVYVLEIDNILMLIYHVFPQGFPKSCYWDGDCHRYVTTLPTNQKHEESPLHAWKVRYILFLYFIKNYAQLCYTYPSLPWLYLSLSTIVSILFLFVQMYLKRSSHAVLHSVDPLLLCDSLSNVFNPLYSVIMDEYHCWPELVSWST